jgi:hypothetical protein
MPENIGSGSTPIYNTKIPRIDENADIQTALRLYHYGDNTSNPGSIIAESIAGHLNELEQSKLDRVPERILNNVNLDNIVTTGFYNQPSVSDARSGARYPEYPDINGTLRFYPGMLKVVNDGGIVFQEYHMVGEVGYPINTVFWRVRYANDWSSWRGFVNEDDILAITDEKYFRTELTYSRAQANTEFSPRLFVENLRTVNHTLVLEDLNRVVAMNVSGGGTLSVPADSTPFPVGSIVNVYNLSSNLLTIAPVSGSGVTVRNAGRLEQFKEASLRKRSATEWVAAGPLY